MVSLVIIYLLAGFAGLIDDRSRQLSPFERVWWSILFVETDRNSNRFRISNLISLKDD